MNIKGFNDLKKDDKPKKDKKTNDYYTGGHSSGLNVEDPEDDVEGFNKQGNKIKLTVWKNGFQIDDGEFRGLDVPENQKFMEEVNKGFIPQELVSKGYKELGIMMEDKKKEDYKPPVIEKKFQAFQGQGKSLFEDSSNSNMSVGLEINKDAKFEVDNNQPKTRINIRFHNGETITQEFNLTHTLHDIRVFVGNTAPVNGTYDLIEGFPPKPITDDSKTIKELKIEGSTITQRLT